MMGFVDVKIRDWPIRSPCAVAYSGGADSSTLLVLAALGGVDDVLAIHVNHGLQEDADFFESHARKTCAKFKIRLQTVRMNARAFFGEGHENQARLQRYLILLETARRFSCNSILLGHHQNDWQESVAMGLMAGGIAGACGFPQHWQTGKIMWSRILFDQKSSVLKSKLMMQNLDWIDDFSNQDLSFLRNQLRAQAAPAIMNFSDSGAKISDFLHDYYSLALRF